MFEWYFSNSNNALWLEAIGTILAACFAFVGIFIAWKSLRKDITSQQEQINYLVDYAKAVRERTEFEKNAYKIEVLPHFRLLGCEHIKDQNLYLMRLKNDGGSYSYHEAIRIIKNPYDITFQRPLFQSMRTEVGGEFHIRLHLSERPFNQEEDTEFEIEFTDETKINMYKQKIIFNPLVQIVVHEVEELN